MPDPRRPALGTICWWDLAVEDAERVRGFYAAVAGWEFRPEEMGGYRDYYGTIPPAE